MRKVYEEQQKNKKYEWNRIKSLKRKWEIELLHTYTYVYIHKNVAGPKKSANFSLCN